MRLILFTGFLLLGACNEAATEKSSSSMDDAAKQRFKDSFVNAEMKKITRNIAFDTTGLYTAPVIITSFKSVKQEYSNYRNVRASWKNISGKTIAGLRFRWYGVNAFNEPAEFGISSDGIGQGFSDSPLGSGKSDSGEWSVLSKDLKKLVIFYPYEVAFDDGSKWTLNGSR